MLTVQDSGHAVPRGQHSTTYTEGYHYGCQMFVQSVLYAQDGEAKTRVPHILGLKRDKSKGLTSDYRDPHFPRQQYEDLDPGFPCVLIGAEQSFDGCFLDLCALTCS